MVMWLASIGTLQGDCWHARPVRNCPSPSSCTDWTGWETNGCNYCGQNNLNYLNVGYSIGKGIDTDQNLINAQLMLLPDFRYENLVPFFTLEGHYLNTENHMAGSIGSGIRWRPASTKCFIGANIFYDAIQGRYHFYNQFGGGLEYLSKSWESRLNFYIPVNQKSGSKTKAVFDDYAGGYIVECNRIEQPLIGIDFEIGRNFYYCDFARFYIGIGPGWYEKASSGDDQWAFKARAYLQLYRYLTFECRGFVEDSYWHAQGVFTLTIPFECIQNFYTCGFLDIISQPVYRNDVIKRSKGYCFQSNF